MSHYRDLNKELVEQVQTMRVNMKLYCDEIISLKAELMQKYESELFLRKYCYNWALDNFQQFIQTIQPDSDILPLLKQHMPGVRENINRRSSSPLRSRASDRIRSSGEKSSGERRRSTQLAMEFQRSNSIINTRNSVRNCSPIRRSCGNDEERSEVADDEQGEQEVGVSEENRVSEEQSNINQVEQPSATEITETAPETNVEVNRDIDLVIYEESEEEDVQEEEEEEEEEEDDEDVDKDEEELQQSAEDNTEESQEDEDQDVESVYESVEEVTINTITKTRNTLSDITNTSVNLSNSNNMSKSLRKRGRPRKHLTEQDSLTDTDTDKEVSAVVIRRIHRTKRITDNSVKDIENTTVQEPRRHSNTRAIAQITNKSIPTTHNLSQTCGEVSLASPISVDMTLRNFKNATSSTPNSRRQSLRRPLTPPPNSPYRSSDTQTCNSTMSDATKLRPTRQCKPKVLVENNLKIKLRNEGEIKKKHKSKSKTSKTSKKK